ncbi:MAG: hemin-degrading factor [Deltaproteobacteria bacterium]|nr:hemin-degrading factor [Deltaproteobacteria bacterium]MCW5805608.1 hemin-degrading factor [Deltaproteobacteria bacterium]
MTTPDLSQRWRALRADKPNLRTRDAAAELGASECELVATLVGDTAQRLDGDAASLLHALESVGRCMALTRNESAVSEVRGRYGGIELGAHAGQVVGEHIDLRVFLDHWRQTFAIEEPHPHKDGERRRSIHVFDRTGTAVHKVYLEPDGDAAAWDAIVAARVAATPVVIEPPPRRPLERADDTVDVSALHTAWDAMQDTHEFFHLLAAHKLARTQALRLAGESRARRVGNDALRTLLHQSAELGDKIMIFVGNRGCIQVFSGAVKRIVAMGPWINVLDPGFNLHLREDRVAQTWVVAKPTRSGVVSSLELFDDTGETIALVFRKRDDRDLAEDPAWRARLEGLA